MDQFLISGLEPDPRLERVTMVPDLAEYNEAKADSPKVGDKRDLYREHAHQFSNEFYSLVESIRRDGVNVPLMIYRNSSGRVLIADGRHRWMAAREAGLTEVPVIMVTESKALDIILDSENRRHFTKGALAYRAVLLCPEVAIEANKGRPNKLYPEDTIYSEELGMNQMGLAKRVGVSRLLISAACTLYKAFTDYPELKKEYEATVWTCANIRKLLGEINSQIEHYKKHGTFKPAPEKPLTDEEKREKEINLKRAEVKSLMLARRYKAEDLGDGWHALTAEDKAVVEEHIKEEIKCLPHEFLETYAAQLSKYLMEKGAVGHE